jgi:hypothetical protein
VKIIDRVGQLWIFGDRDIPQLVVRSFSDRPWRTEHVLFPMCLSSRWSSDVIEFHDRMFETWRGAMRIR